MRIIAAKDYNDMSRKAANIISAQVILKPDCASRSGNRLLPDRHLQAAHRVVQEG